MAEKKVTRSATAAKAAPKVAVKRKPATAKAEATKTRTTTPGRKKAPAKTKAGQKPPAVSAAQVEEQAAKYKRKAAGYRNNPEKTEKLLKDAEEKARKNPGPISGRLQDLATLMRLVRAYFRKEYRDVPWETVALAIGAIAYFVSPIDLIPDFIPIAGYLDDAAVIGFVIASAANDLHNFREWEAAKQMTDA